MSWQKVKLGSILTESKVISEYPDTNKRIKVRLKVLGVEKRGVENEVEGATKQFIRRAGQFIFGKQNFHKGAFGIIPEELDGYESSSDLPAFDIDKSCLPEYLFYFFKQGNYYLELSKIAYGVATQRINMKEFYELEIPLPEIEIQKQIINQFKVLENSGDKINIELTHQLDLIKQLRQAFLREAMQGKLVGSAQLKVGSETGHDLLAKIKAEKAQLIAEKKLKKEKELPPITEDEIPFNIPEHWAWCRLGEICNYGSSPKAEPKDINKDTWVLDLEDIEKETSVLLNKIRFIERNSMSTKSVFKKGEVLYSKLRPYLDKVIVAEEDGVCTTEILPLKLYGSINPYFVKYALKRSDFLTYVNSVTKGMKMPRLGTNDGQVALFPLPPLHEQEQIVAKLEELMAFCDGLEQSIKESQGYNEKLLQQVLREALQVK